MKPPHESKIPVSRECEPTAALSETPVAPVESHPPVRTLKIEADGDGWKGLIKPKIRLMGHWLERAGFRPGHRVHVACVAPGVIELRSPDAMAAIGTKPPS